MPKLLAPIALILPLLLSACGEVKDTRPGQPVAHRQQAFKAILRSFEPMGVQLREKRYDPDKFLQQAQALAGLKDGPWSHFGPDTHYPPTKATARVWEVPERFAQEREQFLQGVDALLAAAATREEARVRPAYEALQQSCRSCHKPFKD